MEIGAMYTVTMMYVVCVGGDMVTLLESIGAKSGQELRNVPRHNQQTPLPHNAGMTEI